jgi:abortive infection bacteriophage resistance protein
MEYLKPYKTYREQVELWISRGLMIENLVAAEQTFARLNYYRLSAYTLPFQKEKDRFDPGARWEDVMRLYEFDRELRILIFTCLEPIEIAARTAICHYLAQKYGPFGYVDAANFLAGFPHHDWLARLKEEQNRSKETFIRHFREKYTESPELPIWIMAEIMSFGTISNLFQGLKFSDQKNIGRTYNLPAPVFSSWLHFLTYIRNLCAHHSRIWNRELAIRPKFPDKTPGWQDVKNDRIISFFAVSQYLFNKIHLQQNIGDSLQKLFREYPQIPLSSMGFQTDWGTKSFWEAG